jgi:hypothetical protein
MSPHNILLSPGVEIELWMERLMEIQTYIYYNRAYLDSASRPEVLDQTTPDSIHPGHPDKPQAAGAADQSNEGGSSGGIRISDVLAKKDGEEVWVVIKGHVYKYVLVSGRTALFLTHRPRPFPSESPRMDTQDCKLNQNLV